MFKFSMHIQQYIKLVLFVSFSVSHYFHLNIFVRFFFFCEKLSNFVA